MQYRIVPETCVSRAWVGGGREGGGGGCLCEPRGLLGVVKSPRGLLKLSQYVALLLPERPVSFSRLSAARVCLV